MAPLTRAEELSLNLKGRGTLFDEWMAGNPFGGRLGGVARGGVNQAFAPLSANYATDYLNQAFGGIGLGQGGLGTFSDFLGTQMNQPPVAPAGLSNVDLADWQKSPAADYRAGFADPWSATASSSALDKLANSMFGTTGGTDLLQTPSATSPLGTGLEALTTMGDTTAAQNIILQNQLQGVNPIFRSIAQQVLAEAFRRFTAGQEEMETGAGGLAPSLLEEFLRQRRGGAGGLGFFGSDLGPTTTTAP